MSSSSERERPRLRRPAEELVGEGVGLYRNGCRWTSELARDEEGEPVAELFLEGW